MLEKTEHSKDGVNHPLQFFFSRPNLSYGFNVEVTLRNSIIGYDYNKFHILELLMSFFNHIYTKERVNNELE